MIGYIERQVHAVKPTHCIVLLGGIGYKIAATKEVLTRLSPGVQVSLWTHLVVREDVLDLYGFPVEEELRLFELLLTVSGIGPKSALGILDIATPETLRSAIASGNVGYLTSMSGIGKKTAEKIILELRDKLGLAAEGTAAALKGDEEAMEAMRALGYSAQEARNALKKVPASIEKGGERLRQALKMLGS